MKSVERAFLAGQPPLLPPYNPRPSEDRTINTSIRAEDSKEIKWKGVFNLLLVKIYRNWTVIINNSRISVKYN